VQELHIIEGDFPPGFKRELVPPDADITRNINNIGPYLAVNGAPFSSLPALRIAANARVDFPSLFSAQYSWRAAAAYAFSNNLVAKIIAGRAYQTPSMDLLFGFSGFGSAYNVIGARTLGLRLVPQAVQSIEAVVTARILDAITADLSVFAQRVDDRIAFVPQQQHFVAANGDPLENGGVELNMRATFPWVSPYVSATALVWNRTDSDGNKALTFDAPALYPNYFLLVGGTVTPTMLPLALNVHGRIVGKRGASDGNVLLNNSEQYYLNAYATVDATLSSRDLHLIGARETVFLVSVRNIADARPSEPGYGGIDLPSNGRQFFVQLRQEL
jgi:iron complex outermembrane receptor protein